ncbi:MAG TPA: glucose-1-phosphate adenylyltransferase [Geobacteraceae bacterium]|nr:glucose-1-phosphate adenylyltransferase [Geobacteraceae bacterium]
MKELLGIILAGGAGERLRPLTASRAKPAVPFGGKYRIIDFVVNNLINSGLQNIKILVQSLSQPLINHVNKLWPSMPVYNFYVQAIPAQKRVGEEWYKSTADAVFQNLNVFTDNPQYNRVAIFSGDHIFKMDAGQFDSFHQGKGADFSISSMVIQADEAHRFGILEIDENNRVIGFEEKPKKPKEIPGKPGYCLTSMGNYIADIPLLIDVLHEDAKDIDSSHDFGKDVIPFLLKKGARIFAYDFSENKIPGEVQVYWRDVGTIGSYWEANMDLVGVNPELNLYNDLWPIKTTPDFTPPAKFVFRQSLVDNSILSGGCIVTQAELSNSVLSQRVRVERGALVCESVIFAGVTIGEGVKIRKAIIDKNVQVPRLTRIGYSREEDEARGLIVSDGITVIPKNYIFT